MTDRLPKSKGDTSLGGEKKAFPSTHWSLVLGLQDSALETRRRALESLCQRYWKPAYHYIRRAWSKTPDDAKDLTQAFFLQILEGDALRAYAPERGGFRTFLKVVLRRFAADQHDAVTALKRGGGVKILALDGTPAPLQESLADGQAVPPEQLFDRAWKKEILERAVERARQFFRDADREVQFRAFEEYEMGGEPRTYGEVAAALKVSESDVRNYLFAARERLRMEIRAELSQTVTDLRQLDEEWNDLFGG